MKKSICILLSVVLTGLVLSGCATTSSISSYTETTAEKTTEAPTSTKAETKAASSTSKSSFTNKYGSSTTKCAHSGCNNYIASSGDTNCCTTHSNKCLECGCYIDEDAMYCMSCIEKAANKSNSSSKKSYSSSYDSKPSETGEGGYDMPKDGESFSDYVKRVDPDLYEDMVDNYYEGF